MSKVILLEKHHYERLEHRVQQKFISVRRRRFLSKISVHHKPLPLATASPLRPGVSATTNDTILRRKAKVHEHNVRSCMFAS